MAKDEIEKLANIFKALSDPTRLKIIKFLIKNKGHLCVNALACKLNITQSAVSQHLRVLKQVGLVQSKRKGFFVHYFINKDEIEQYKTIILNTLGEDFVVVK